MKLSIRIWNCKTFIKKEVMINVGDKAPEVLGINEKGEEIRLSAYKG